MTSLAMAAAEQASKHMSPHQAISSIAGSISMAAWICVILPQMVVNYRTKSAEALSMPFLIVWMLGDATNLTGGLLTHLAPTAIALAMYFCVADFLLISQCAYYNAVNARRAAELSSAGSTEDAPLLARRNTSPPRRQQADAGKTGPAGDEAPEKSAWLFNLLSLLAVHFVGLMGWFLSYQAGAWRDAGPDAVGEEQGAMGMLEIVGMALGYISAVCYLCARIPQIIKNYREQSCEGLAVLFFMLSLTGNLTYAISVVAYSQDKRYLVNAIPWLIGSFGTVVEDAVIFVQFLLYANNRRSGTLAQV